VENEKEVKGMNNFEPVKNVTLEALSLLRAHYDWNLKSLNATDAERELARMKIGLIDIAVGNV
jgi:hypothetical protein